jgi:cyclic pyranopterin phosphate synthase
VKVDIGIVDKSTIRVSSTVKTEAQTGVEMEALVATAISLLTIWDMVKQYEKDADGQYPFTTIEEIRVVKKVKEEKPK